MKILIIGDCHGKRPEIPEEDFDLVLAIGDICGGSEEMRSAMFQSIDDERSWYEIYGDGAKEAVKESIREGKEILEVLNSLGPQVLIVPGNWDWSAEDSEWSFLEDKGYPQMLEEFDNIQDLNFSKKEFQGLNFIGYGPCSGPEIPQYEDDKPDSEEELAEMEGDYRDKKKRLKELFDPETETVFLSHNAPNGTDLDMIDNPDSPKHGRHYGSLIVREILEEESPAFNIAGHMHESEGLETISGVKCLNTGLHNVWKLDTEEGEFSKL